MIYQEFLGKTRELFLRYAPSIHIEVEPSGEHTIYRISKNVTSFYYKDQREDKAIENLIQVFQEVLEGAKLNTIFKLYFHTQDFAGAAKFMEEWVNIFENVALSDKSHLFGCCYKNINPYFLIKAAKKGNNTGEIIPYVLNQSQIEGDNPRDGTVYDTVCAIKTHVPNFAYVAELKIFLDNHSFLLKKANEFTVNNIYKDIQHFVAVEHWQMLAAKIPGLVKGESKNDGVTIGKSSYRSEVFSVFHQPVREQNSSIASDLDLLDMVKSLCQQINQKNQDYFLPDLVNIGVVGQLAAETLVAVTYHNPDVMPKIEYILNQSISYYNELMLNKTPVEQRITMLDTAFSALALDYSLPQKLPSISKPTKI